MHKFRRKHTPIGPGWLRWLMALAASACMGTATAVAIQWVVTGSLSIVWAWAAKYPGYFAMTAALLTVVVFTLGALLGRLWMAGAVTGGVGLTLSLVDYFKTAINGTPLELADFGLVAQVGQVAGVAGDLTPPVDFWMALTALAVCVGLLAVTGRLTAIRGRTRFLSFSLALCLLLGASGPAAVEAGALFGVDVFTRMDATSSHDTYGLALSLWRSAALQDKTPPEGYGPEYMAGVLARVDELLSGQETAPAERPNILFILSESFYDVTRLPDLTYDRDPVANFHALAQESISGSFHSHYLGYGTGYIEMSMLSGLNSLDLGPGTNICFMEDETYQRFDALPEQYTGGGDYRAEMLHGYNNSLYNRTVTYPLLGFDRLLFSEDIQALDFPWDDGIYGGYYMRDDYFFRAMLDRMETINDGGERAFLFGITMENHQPFDPEKFGYACQVDVRSRTLSEPEMAVVRVMVEGITRADQALGALVDQLRQSDEPTIVVFFGDHRPNLFMPDGETVYTKLGLCPENDTVNWTAEQVNDLYSTDYLIWANDPALLRGQAGARRDSSITAIGPQLLELTGGEVSRYWRLLELTAGIRLTDTELYRVDAGGAASLQREAAEPSLEEAELLALRDAVIYDAVYGEGYITDAMNRPVAG